MRTTLFALVLLASPAFADPDRDALHEAARLGDVAKVKALLAKGADVNARNRFGATPLWFAAYKNRTEVVQVLLAAKADPNLADHVWESAPLPLAASFDSAASVKLLLAAKAKGGDNVLITSAASGKSDLVAAVLEHHKPSADVLSTALLLTRPTAKEIREALTKAGAKLPPSGSVDEQKEWKSLEGRYQTPSGAPLFVQMREGVLLVAGRMGPTALRSVGKLEFALVGEDKVRLRFEMQEGKVVRIVTDKAVYEPTLVKKAEKPGPYKDEGGVVRTVKNWPSFRGEGASGVADGQHPPAVWDVKKLGANSWKTAIPGLGHSCPVIWGDQLFITTAVSSDPKSELKPGMYGALTMAKDRTKHTWKVYCLDRKTGKIVWEKTACEGVPQVKRHIKATHANATVATDGKHLIVSFASEGLYCYSLEGKLLWKKDLGFVDPGAFNDPEVQWEAGSSPIIHRHLAIVQCDRQKDSYMAAFQLDSGKEAWRTPRDEPPSWGTPTVIESKTGAELVANGTTAVRGYDPATGKELWSLGRNAQITVPTPFTADGLIFVTSGYAPIQPIYAIWPGARGDLTLKSGVESSAQIAWSKVRGGPYMPTPIAYRGHLYVCANAGLLTCYETRTGKQVYSRRLTTTNGYTASPVAADGRLYFCSEEGQVQVVEAGPTFRLLTVQELGETCLTTPAIAGGMIYFRTQGHVLGIGRE